MRKQICLLIVMMILTGCTAIQSDQNGANDHQNKPVNLLTYLASVDLEDEINEVTAQFQDRFGLDRSCGESLKIETYSYGVEMPLKFTEGRDHPVQGVWQHRYLADQCGVSKLYNAIFIADKNGGRPQALPLVPGSTSASVRLLKDARTSALVAAVVKIKESGEDQLCHELTIFDTEVIKGPHDLTENGVVYKGVWFEEWTIVGCGNNVNVTARFVPKNDGGTLFSFK